MFQHKIKSESLQWEYILQAEFHSALTRKKTLHDNTTYSRGKNLVQSSYNRSVASFGKMLVLKVLRVL